jgi:tetratricopeptide (TPR) repeat protein
LAIEHARVAHERSPQAVEYGRLYALLNVREGNNQFFQNRLDAGRRAYEEGIDARQKLARDNPAIPDLLSDLVDGCIQFRVELERHKQSAEALRVLRRAFTDVEGLAVGGPGKPLGLARLLAAAAVTVDPSAPAAEDEARRRRDADHAMDALRQAVANGYRGAPGLRDDPRFKDLRTRDDFKALATDLERPSAVQARVAETASPRRPEAPGRTGDEGATVRADLAASQHAIGLIQLGLGDRDEARKSLAEAIALRESLAPGDPETVRMLDSLARLPRDTGLDGPLLTGLLRASEARPDDPHVLALRGVTLGRLGLDDRAEADLDAAGRLDPLSREIWTLRARSHAERGRYRQCAEDLDRTLALARRGRFLEYWITPDVTGLDESCLAHDAVFEHLVRLRPEDQAVYVVRADALARRGDWAGVAAALKTLLALDPDNYTYWYVASVAFPRAGDVASYHWVCREMLARFERSDDLNVAMWSALACVTLPYAVDDYREPAARAARSLGKRTERHWPVLAVAAVDYRAGRYEAAAERLSAWRPGPFRTPPTHLATSHVVLAMAYHRLGRTAEARRELVAAAGVAWEFPFAEREVTPYGYWHDWLRYNILRREADALILDPDFPADPFAR